MCFSLYPFLCFIDSVLVVTCGYNIFAEIMFFVVLFIKILFIHSTLIFLVLVTKRLCRMTKRWRDFGWIKDSVDPILRTRIALFFNAMMNSSSAPGFMNALSYRKERR